MRMIWRVMTDGNSYGDSSGGGCVCAGIGRSVSLQQDIGVW